MANYTLGLDLGKERDPSALVIAERINFTRPAPLKVTHGDGYELLDAYQVRHIVRFELGTPYDAVVGEVARLMTTDQLREESLLVFDRTGVGGAVADLFQTAYQRGELGPCQWPLGITLTGGFGRHAGASGYYQTSVHKGDLVQRLYMLLERGLVKIPLGLAVADQLTKEVRAFRLKQSTTTGNLSFEAEREADHDDLVIALALAVWFPHPWGEPRVIHEPDESVA
jgi:hypothetical protein